MNLVGIRIPRRWCLLAGLGASVPLGLAADKLVVSLHDDQIQVGAPQLNVLTGRALERLKNAATVAFDFQLTLWVGTRNIVRQRVTERFLISYDLWEEKFSVVRVRAPRKFVSHLSQRAAEEWCLNHLALPAAAVPAGQQFWLRLDVLAEEAKDQARLVDDAGLNLGGLIELFSRPQRGDQQRWLREAGPLGLKDLKR